MIDFAFGFLAGSASVIALLAVYIVAIVTRKPRK